LYEPYYPIATRPALASSLVRHLFQRCLKCMNHDLSQVNFASAWDLLDSPAAPERIRWKIPQRKRVVSSSLPVETRPDGVASCYALCGGVVPRPADEGKGEATALTLGSLFRPNAKTSTETHSSGKSDEARWEELKVAMMPTAHCENSRTSNSLLRWSNERVNTPLHQSILQPPCHWIPSSSAWVRPQTSRG